MTESWIFAGTMLVAFGCLLGWVRSGISNRWLTAEVALMRRAGYAQPEVEDVAIEAALHEWEGRPG